MATREMRTKVTDVPATSRYEMTTLDGDPVGFLQYEVLPGRMVLAHVEVDPRFEGRGLGGELTKAALDDCRARGLAVVPQCPFTGYYIRKNPEYADLVAR